MLINTENCPPLFVKTAFGEGNFERGDCVLLCCCTKCSCLDGNLPSPLAIFPQNCRHI